MIGVIYNDIAGKQHVAALMRMLSKGFRVKTLHHEK